MSNEEIIAAVSQKYGRTITGRAGALYELARLKVDNGCGRDAVWNMRVSLIQKVKGSRRYAGMWVDNPMQEAQLTALVNGTTVSWGRFGAAALDVMADSGHASGSDYYRAFQKNLEELLEDLMEAGA